MDSMSTDMSIYGDSHICNLRNFEKLIRESACNSKHELMKNFQQHFESLVIRQLQLIKEIDLAAEMELMKLKRNRQAINSSKHINDINISDLPNTPSLVSFCANNHHLKTAINEYGYVNSKIRPTGDDAHSTYSSGQKNMTQTAIIDLNKWLAPSSRALYERRTLLNEKSDQPGKPQITGICDEQANLEKLLLSSSQSGRYSMDSFEIIGSVNDSFSSDKMPTSEIATSLGKSKPMTSGNPDLFSWPTSRQIVDSDMAPSKSLNSILPKRLEPLTKVDLNKWFRKPTQTLPVYEDKSKLLSFEKPDLSLWLADYPTVDSNLSSTENRYNILPKHLLEPLTSENLDQWLKKPSQTSSIYESETKPLSFKRPDLSLWLADSNVKSTETPSYNILPKHLLEPLTRENLDKWLIESTQISSIYEPQSKLLPFERPDLSLWLADHPNVNSNLPFTETTCYNILPKHLLEPLTRENLDKWLIKSTQTSYISELQSKLLPFERPDLSLWLADHPNNKSNLPSTETPSYNIFPKHLLEPITRENINKWLTESTKTSSIYGPQSKLLPFERPDLSLWLADSNVPSTATPSHNIMPKHLLEPLTRKNLDKWLIKPSQAFETHTPLSNIEEQLSALSIRTKNDKEVDHSDIVAMVCCEGADTTKRPDRCCKSFEECCRDDDGCAARLLASTGPELKKWLISQGILPADLQARLQMKTASKPTAEPDIDPSMKEKWRRIQFLLDLDDRKLKIEDSFCDFEDSIPPLTKKLKLSNQAVGIQSPRDKCNRTAHEKVLKSSIEKNCTANRAECLADLMMD